MLLESSGNGPPAATSCGGYRGPVVAVSPVVGGRARGVMLKLAPLLRPASPLEYGHKIRLFLLRVMSILLYSAPVFSYLPRYRYNHFPTVYHRFLRLILGAPPRVLLTMSGLPSLDSRIRGLAERFFPRAQASSNMIVRGIGDYVAPGHPYRRIRDGVVNPRVNDGRGSIPMFVCREIGKTTLSTPDRDSNLDLPINSSQVYCETSAFDHAAIEADILYLVGWKDEEGRSRETTGFAFLPFLWCVNAVWFFKDAFIKPPYEEQKNVILSAIGALIWVAGLTTWIVTFQTQRAQWECVPGSPEERDSSTIRLQDKRGLDRHHPHLPKHPTSSPKSCLRWKSAITAPSNSVPRPVLTVAGLNAFQTIVSQMFVAIKRDIPEPKP
uniref:Gamma-secretase subunit PEN-2 n=1 Tax=Timema monikensis TaxID=170555 RepID=A0A7R9E7G3_9NEOP|nr:unnamed protein product [Timema monikensis]